ncbi:glycosyltransferase family 4 protein [Halobacillus yeomjeoni]|uniref:Glycosyltransferase family 4 protein n=1 Tax=Halobacillus yeomjeoni TaxID=311194 RepID=A0A931HY09_9BACI|nr:glycosyltransferase family 4 protein [Halobacillus yeomjeoni]MBH0231514.1 glycosyltransferase family 4 protein [Halobacillus yeomjeoni]
MIQELRTKELNKRMKRLPYAMKQKLTKKGDTPKDLHIVYTMTNVSICGGVKVILEHANKLQNPDVKVTLLSHFQKPTWFPIEAEYIQIPFDLELAKGIPDCDLIVATYWDHVQSCIETGIAPVVYFEQGDFHLFEYEAMKPPLKKFVHKQFEIVPYIYTVSNQASQIISKIYGREAEVFPNAVDETIFSVNGDKETGERPYILMVGGGNAAFKGIPTIIDAFTEINKEMEIELYWVTPEPPNEEMKSKVTKIFVAPSQQVIANLYRGAELYVCGSTYESFGLPSLEAMACGCPVVTTDNPGSLEYAVHRKNANVCNMKDAQDMAKKIIEVLSDSQLKEKLITNGLETVQKYNWEKIIGDIQEYYRKVASHEVDGHYNQDEDWDIGVQPDDFLKKEDYKKFIKFLKVTNSDLVKVPVIYKINKVPDIARWEVAACRKKGELGLTDHCFCPVPPLNKLQLHNLPGYGSFLINEYSKALDEFQSLTGDEDDLGKAVTERWVILTLLRLQMKHVAKKRLAKLQRLYPHNADFYLLETLISEEASLKSSNFEMAKILGDATSYPEFFFDVHSFKPD